MTIAARATTGSTNALGAHAKVFDLPGSAMPMASGSGSRSISSPSQSIPRVPAQGQP
jgi:hypothetical protein